MKALVIFLLLPVSLFAQKLPVNSDGKIVFSEVVRVDNNSAKALYSKAKAFLGLNFKSDAIVLDDVSQSQLTVKGSLASDPGTVNFTFTIECKDNRYKYTVQQFYHSFYSPGGSDLSGGALENYTPLNPLSQAAWQDVKKNTNQSVQVLIDKLKDAMAKNDAW